jgi:Domain of unknown function (DUF4403)
MRRLSICIFLGISLAINAKPTVADDSATSAITVSMKVDVRTAVQWLQNLVGPGLLYQEVFTKKECLFRGRGGKILGKLNPSCGTVTAVLGVSLVPGSLRIEAIDGGLRAMATLGLEATGDLKALFGVVDIPVDTDGIVDVGATLTFAVDRDWKLVPNVKLLPHHWINRPDLRAAGVNVARITGVVDKAIEKARHSLAANAQREIAQALDLKPHVEKLWQRLSKPREVTPGVWMNLTPLAFGVARLQRDGEYLLLPLSLRAQIHFGTEARRRTMPDSLPPRSDTTASSASRIVADAEVPLNEVAKMIGQHAKLPSDIEIADGVSINVSEWALRPGEQNKIKIGAKFSAESEASTPTWVWLSAHIAFDHETAEIVLTDVAIDEETDSYLGKAAGLVLLGINKDIRIGVRDYLTEVEILLSTPHRHVIRNNDIEAARLELVVEHPNVFINDVVIDDGRLLARISASAMLAAELHFALPEQSPRWMPGLAHTPPTYINRPFTPPTQNLFARPGDLGRPVSSCACWNYHLGTVVPFDTCQSRRSVVVACTIPCGQHWCPAMGCVDGAPIRMGVCAM